MDDAAAEEFVRRVVTEIHEKWAGERFAWRTLYSWEPLSYEVFEKDPFRGDLLLTTSEAIARHVTDALNDGRLQLDADGNLPLRLISARDLPGHPDLERFRVVCTAVGAPKQIDDQWPRVVEARAVALLHDIRPAVWLATADCPGAGFVLFDVEDVAVTEDQPT
ncbi:hypothetical protein [Microbispora sp. NPDC049125]|uniref:hypothetical protein n=1 Tax=Microbispora sp. NPDC049125 TaxID=3154929 RepID=UPI003466D9FA